MTTPHAELAALYFADVTLKCWARDKDSDDKWDLLHSPLFISQDVEYYVGHEPPPPDKPTIDNLRAQLAEAQKDSDRLDWIEQNANMGVVINRLKLITDLSRLVYEVAVDDVYVTEDTLRAAIDAAKGESNG